MSNPLTAFALVAEEYQQSGDPILGLKPLFAPLLVGKGGQVFDPAQFAADFSSTYGLSMSTFVAAALRERLAVIGLLEARRDGGTDIYTIVGVERVQPTFDESRIDDTVGVFVRWATNECTRLGRVLNAPTLEDALLSRLARPGFASIFLEESPASRTARLKSLLGRGGVDPGTENEVFLDYLVAQFVLTSEAAPEVFEAISSITYGSLIADAVAGLAVPGQSDMPDPPLRVVLDGPILMDLLDLNTVAHRDYANDLIAMLRKAGLRLATFDHLIDEMRGTISATLAAHAGSVAHGPLADRIRANREHRLYATAVADSLEDRIKALDVTILRGEIYEEARFKRYFNGDQEDRVRNAIGDMHHQLERRIRDAKSVALVARLKGENKSPSSVLRAGTIFVTRNSALCSRVNRVLSLGKSEPSPRFTIATDGQIAGILWFVLGSDGAFDMSRKRLVANCAAAVSPQREVISRISETLSGLDGKLGEEFEALMRDSRASLCPMRITAGLSDVVDEDMSLQILNEMKRELIAPVAEAAQEQREKSRDEIERMAEELRRSRDTAVLLQNALGINEDQSGRDRIAFDEQLVQLSFNLDAAKHEREQAIRQTRAVQADISGRIANAQTKYGEGVAKSLRRIRIVAYGGMAIVTIASWFTESMVAKVVTGIAAIACLPPVAPWFDNMLARSAERHHRQEKRILDEIKRGDDMAG